MDDWMRLVPFGLGIANLIVTLYVRLSISQLETKIADARRRDREWMQEWTEARFERRVEAPGR